MLVVSTLQVCYFWWNHVTDSHNVMFFLAWSPESGFKITDDILGFNDEQMHQRNRAKMCSSHRFLSAAILLFQFTKVCRENRRLFLLHRIWSSINFQTWKKNWLLFPLTVLYFLNVGEQAMEIYYLIWYCF